MSETTTSNSTDSEEDWHDCAACGAEYRSRSAALKCCTEEAETSDTSEDGLPDDFETPGTRESGPHECPFERDY